MNSSGSGRKRSHGKLSTYSTKRITMFITVMFWALVVQQCLAKIARFVLLFHFWTILVVAFRLSITSGENGRVSSDSKVTRRTPIVHTTLRVVRNKRHDDEEERRTESGEENKLKGKTIRMKRKQRNKRTNTMINMIK